MNNKGAWITVGCVVLAGLLGWGAWNTLATANAVPRPEYVEHKNDNEDKFMEILKEIQQQRTQIEDKLDEIQEKL